MTEVVLFRGGRRVFSVALACCLLLAVTLVRWVHSPTYTHSILASREAQVISASLPNCSLYPSSDWFNDPRRSVQLSQYTHRVFYNRVPKCASGLSRFVFEELHRQNRFNMIVDSGRPDNIQGQNQWLDNATLRKRVMEPLYGTTPTLLVGHIHFVSPEYWGQRRSERPPVYINLTRDPLSRLVSWYHFIRFHNQRIMSTEERFRSYDECVAGGWPECSDPDHIFTQVPYFCGQDPRCLKPIRWALDRAITNVRSYYSVVGYMDRLDDFFLALEVMLPRFFTNATRVYDEMRLRTQAVRAQDTVLKPNAANSAIMRTRLSLEYEFYAFIKERFDCLMARIQNEKPNTGRLL